MAIKDNILQEKNPFRERSKSWLALLRPPNLLTVPGDPVAGFLIASAAASSSTLTDSVFQGFIEDQPAWGRALVAALAVLLIYIHGLIGNDLADLPEDRLERPERPLPAGGIGLPAAWILCVTAAAAGIVISGMNGMAGIAIAAILVTVVLLYNMIMKRFQFFGPLFMGSCRALSFLTGAVAAGWRGEMEIAVLSPALLLGAYVAAVTSVARHETRFSEPGFRRWLPAGALLLGFTFVGWTTWTAEFNGWSFALWLGLPMTIGATLTGRRLGERASPMEVQQSVGSWLRNLLFLQFSLVSIGWGSLAIPGVVGSGLWLIHRALARRFYIT